MSLPLGIVMACGGTPLTPEEALTKRAESFNLEVDNENWLEAHKYLSPRAREVCKNGDFAFALEIGYRMLKGFIGIPEDEKFTSSILDVTVDGDIGFVYSELKHDGDVIKSSLGGDAGQAGRRWVYVDGEWWEGADRDVWASICEMRQ